VADFFSSNAKNDTPLPSDCEALSENGDDPDQPEKLDTVNGQGSSTLSGSMGMMMLMRRAANHRVLVRRFYNDRKIRPMAKKLLKDKTYKENREESIRLDLMKMSDHQIYLLCQNHP